jgi:hypothetical protein
MRSIKRTFPLAALALLLIGVGFFGPSQPQAAVPGYPGDDWIVEMVDGNPITNVAVAEVAAPAAAATQPAKAPESTPAEKPLQSSGPGFIKQTTSNASGCNCENCLTESDVKRIVAAELATRGYGSARPVASNGSTGGSGQVAVSRPVTAVYGERIVSERVVSSTPTQSPAVVYSQPTTVTYQTSQPVYRTPVRTVVRGVATGVRNTTCRIVNGVRVCN